jgi:protocatechuate 3,4-dioxygenase beta subunit
MAGSAGQGLQLPAPMAPGTATITGRAVDGVTGTPLPGTVVGLMRNPQDGGRLPGRSVMTDAQGRFAFSGLPAGRYALTTTRPGWTMGIYGVEEPRLPEATTPYNLTLQNGQRTNVSVPVWRDAVLSGRVTTTTGEAVGNARVYASQWMVSMGRRTLSRSLTFADDRGVFSIRVRPGDYVMSALSDDGRARGVGATPGTRFGLAPTYYPASPDVTGATIITAKSGDERDGLDIRMPLVPAQRVTGTLVSTDGAAIPTRISLTSEADTGFQRAVAVDTGGRFAFDYVPAGRYLIATLFNGVVTNGGRGGTASDSWTRTSVEVAGADIDVTVPVHRGLRVSGRVQFDGTAAPTASSVTLTPDTEGPASDVVPPAFPVDSDGRFTVTVTPGRYIVTASGQAPFGLNAPEPTPGAIAAARSWTLRSAVSGGVDVSSTALTVTRDVSDVLVTLTDRSAELRGRVLNIQNVDDTTVLLFPSDESLWLDFGIGRRMRTARPAVDGSFAFAAVPAGEYYVSAVRGMTPRDWRSGAVFDVLAPLASRLSLDEGVVTTRDLQAATAPKPRAALLKPPALTLAAIDVADVRPATARGSQGSIAGRVLDAATQAPIAGMRLSLSANLEPGVYSDEAGRFLLADVAPGQHTIHSLKHGYVPTIYGARRPDEPGTPVSVAVGQQVTDLTFPIMRGASITGTVIDHHGLPMSDVEVGVRQYRWQPQGRELVAVRTVGRLGPTLTEADGSFRIYGLAPGDYVLDARTRSTAGISPVTLTTEAELNAAAGKPSGSQPVTAMYPSLSYPTATDMARGARLRLGAAEERTLSLQMELVPIANVSGLVRGPDGQPLSRVGVQLVASEPASAAGIAPIRLAQSDNTGQFTITGVLPGRYTLVTRAPPVAGQPGTNLAGSVEVTVSGDVDGVVLDLGTAQTLTGRVRTRSGTTPQLPNVRLQAVRIGAPISAASQTPTASWDAEGRFTFTTLLPGRYRLVLSGARNQILPAIVAQMINGQETLSRGVTVGPGATASVDLILASGPSQLSGRIRTTSPPPRELFLILFAREAEAWASPAVRVFATRADQNNQFTFRDVPPGDYWIAPVTDVEPNAWFDPELLKTLAANSQAVSVVDGNSPELVVALP